VRRRDIYILIGLGVVVIIVAWYFLMISPKRDELSQVAQDRDGEKRQYETDKARLERLPEERSAALQAEEDLLKINKLVPIDEQVPSLIIELQQSADQAGIDFVKIAPQPAVSSGDNTIVPMEISVEGRFFDVNDFLYRVENYARLEGSDVNVSGRLVSVVTLSLEEGEFLEWPNVTANLGVNTYMTEVAPPSNTAGRASQSSTSSAADEAQSQ
jgi:Tfp pilus assembly protein PilO